MQKSMQCFFTSLPSETNQEMEAANEFNNLTWADLTIIDDKLKTVWEFDNKSLKYRDFRIVCNQLKIMGFKSSSKE